MTVEKQTVLKAENSKILTNGNTYGTVVYLAPEDSENNWYEITVEEYEQIMADMEGGETNV